MTTKEISCGGCAARFALRINDRAPLRAILACPRCGAPIPLRRTEPNRERENSAPLSSSKVTPSVEAQPQGWKTIEPTAVFGNLSAPPAQGTPGIEKTPGKRRFQEPRGPSLGLFSGTAEGALHRTRAPEADRPDGVRPLASALLRELQDRSSSPESRRGSTSSRTTASTGSKAERSANSSSADSPSPEDLDASWLFDAVDSASEELFFVDDSPLPLARLPGPREKPEEDIRKEPPPVTPSEATSSPEAEPAPSIESTEAVVPPGDAHPGDPHKAVQIEPLPEAAVPPSPTGKRPDPQEAPPAASEDRPTKQEGLFTIEIPELEKSYSLKVGEKVYQGIPFSGLMELFRRGVWLLASEIAEESEDSSEKPHWVPLDEHPIYQRVRSVVAEGVTQLLHSHAQQVYDIQVHAEPPVLALLDREAVPQVQLASNTLPWSIALISTGVAGVLAGAILTYAAFGAPPFPSNLENQGEQVQEARALEPAALAPGGEATRQAEIGRRQEALYYAQELIETAARPDEVTLAREALKQENYGLARTLAAYAFRSSPNRFRLQEVFDESLATDPNLRRPEKTLARDQGIDLIRALGGGSSITFRLTEGGESRYAFKVNRQEWEEGYRAEVAAYLLCQMLPCDFQIPENQPARISRQDFEELYGRLNTPRQLRYAERFDEKIWRREAGPDEVEADYLYGALKEWIPSYTNFPVEHTQLWRPYLDINSDKEILNTSFDDFLIQLRPFRDGHFARGLAEHYNEETVAPLARQISNLTVFDYLISNFDRHSGIFDYYGVNAHFADGRFMAIDNSAAFQFRPRAVMETRLAMVSRFDRHLIDGIRLLRPEEVNELLFPNPSASEQLRLRTFWEQRDRLLTYVDTLVDEYGADAVYTF